MKGIEKRFGGGKEHQFKRVWKEKGGVPSHHNEDFHLVVAVERVLQSAKPKKVRTFTV